MDLSPQNFPFPEAVRKDGWSPEHKARFLTLLAEAGNVRSAARRCGLSAQSAYVQRRRDALFARGWAAAMVLAQEHGEQVLADRAIEGVEEQIYYRGELVGTRRRYDSRLLLAHLARLDRQAQDDTAADDAERFDELVALVAGAGLPETLAETLAELPDEYDDELPPTQMELAEQAAEAAEHAAALSLPRADGMASEAERAEAIAAAGDAAYAGAEVLWDTWFDTACATVDRLAGDGDVFDPAEVVRLAEVLPQDSVNPSTSASPIPPPTGEGDHEVVEGHPQMVPTSGDHPPVPLHHPADGPPPRAGEDLLAARTRIVSALARAGGDPVLLDRVNQSTSASPVPPPTGEGDHEVVEGHARMVPTSGDHPPVPLHHPAGGPPPRAGEDR